MRFIPNNTQLIFLGNISAEGIAPQISFYDAYYTGSPAVGFHVIADPTCPPVTEFIVTTETECSAEVGFYVSEDADPPVASFSVENSVDEDC